MDGSIHALLRERASLQPDDTAFTFIDYDQDWDGVAETLTWVELYRRDGPGRRLDGCGFDRRPGRDIGATGARLHRRVSRAMQAGQIAVPLSVPLVASR